MKEHYLYKYIYKGDIIYIGKTNDNLERRIFSHINEDKFLPYIKEAEIYVMKLSNCTEVNALEMLLINKYRPILNCADKYDEITNIKFEELPWNTYQSYLDSHCNDEINLKNIEIQKTKCIRYISNCHLHLSSLENEKKLLIPMPTKEYMDKISKIERDIRATKKEIVKYVTKYKYYKMKGEVYGKNYYSGRKRFLGL